MTRSSRETIERTMKWLPGLEELEGMLRDDPESIFPAEGSASRLRSINDPGLTAFEQQDTELRGMIVEEAASAVSKIREAGPNAELNEREQTAYEAIVLVLGRPAILIQDGRFFPPPANWSLLENFRAGIQTVFRSVGRVEVQGHPQLEWIGTGFLVGDGLVMTNRHVAKEFSLPAASGEWVFEPSMSVEIDFVEEFNSPQSIGWKIQEVVAVHPTLDLALLRLDSGSLAGRATPTSLTIAASPPPSLNGRNVYAVGYPAWDGRRNDPSIMDRIFSNIYNVKRLQPGQAAGGQAGIFAHDCSTLGGNSGSCIVDLESNQVIGLHFSGRYLQGNLAVALWELAGDPILKRAGVRFG